MRILHFFKYKNIKVFINDSVLRTNSWADKFKDLNGDKLIGRFYEKELLLSIL